MVKPPLTIVGPRATDDQPPRPLGEHGAQLWRTVLAEYVIEDCAGRELLCQAAQALDRAESLAAEIAADGPVIRTRGGIPRSHPSIRDELAARSFVTKTIQRLGLNFEAVRASVGRPSNLRA
jgi:hypothetical protein